MAVAHELFQKLPPEEREEWKAKAKDTADHNQAEYRNLLKAPPSKDPVQCQLCINNFPAFAVPLLKGISECTGLHVFMFLGGPMLKQKGELGTMSLSWGKNNEPKPVGWPEWNETRFKEKVQDFYMEYLCTVYTEADKDLARLPDAAGGSMDGLIMMNNALKGMNEDLAEVSDSSSDEESSDDDDRPSPEHPAKKQK
ncbi:hypothetical protein ARMSODRAFT_1026029 [Armillaria solidipes]|uniref:Uncharacterized protein n=1 Tax=Armillaria solidipes TaxID=1076256 RepID=A0A2H3AQ54_9AGAR|nr:hypothetical protein ARMSODRAFT_1026029 [Armillaria solidipes]